MRKRFFHLGAVPNPPDARDYPATLYLPSVTEAPDVIDLPMPAVRDQAKLGACVAFAHSAQQGKNDQTILSPEHLFTECKARDGQPKTDGTTPRVANDVMVKVGIAEEGFWPYEGRYPAANPPQPGYLDNAAKHRIAVYASVENTPDAIGHALSVGQPVTFSLPVYDSFFGVGADGMVPDPTGTLRGYHRLVIRGREHTKGLVWFQNSWGLGWGKNGLAAFRYDQLGQLMDLSVVTDMPDGVVMHWLDWPAGKFVVEQDVLYNTKAADGQPVMRGYRDGNFRPYSLCTRASVASTIQRLGLQVPVERWLDNYRPATGLWLRRTFPMLPVSANVVGPVQRLEVALTIVRYILAQK